MCLFARIRITIMSAVRPLVVSLLAALVVLPPVVRGQASDSMAQASDTTAKVYSPVVERVIRSFAEGNANRLLVPSADRVEIALFGARTHYSSSQALYVLRDFFRSHAPEGFVLRDVMETPTTCLVRGEYTQARVAQRLKIYVRLDQGDDEDVWRLRELTIGVAPE